MIHEPELLILDEPTIGLDPNQIRQVRELIKNLRRHHTILLSTHIFAGSGDDLLARHHYQQGTHRSTRYSGELALPHQLGRRSASGSEDRGSSRDRQAAFRTGVKDVVQKKMGDWTRFILHVESDPRETLHALAVKEGWPVRELTRRCATLEQVFAEVTHSEEQ